MLSSEQRFLFLHIPKTGGNSIQDALREYSDDRIVSLAAHQDGVERFELRSDHYGTEKHSTLAAYRGAYGPVLFDSLHCFTCVRNPWQRVLSYYFSPHRGAVEWSPQDFLAFIPKVPPMRHYLALPGDDPATLEVALRHVHRVMRFERLQEDFDEFCAALRLPQRKLAQRNRSVREPGRPWRDHFDRASRQLVAERFGDEAACFGYSF